MTTLQTAGAAMDSADALKELIAQQAVEIERLQGHIKHIGNDALRSEVERLRKDAERYRWLRELFGWDNEGGYGYWEARFKCDEHWSDLDAAIDAAIQKETP